MSGLTPQLPSSGNETLAALRDGTALKSLLAHAVPYEKTGAPMSPELVGFGFLGACLLLACALGAVIAPRPEVIAAGGLFLVLGQFVADIAEVLRHLAPTAAVAGAIGLAVDAVLLGVPTGEWSRWLVAVQLIAGLTVSAVVVLGLAAVVLNIAIWIALGVLLLLAIFALLAGMLAGG